MGISLLCKDSKAYARVNKKTNFAKVDSRRLNGKATAWKCIGNDYFATRTYEKAGFTSFSAYRITFESTKAYLARNDFLYSESQSIQLHSKTVNNQIKAGKGGDCYAWNNCKDNKKGEFSIDLSGTKLAFDPSVQWKANGWPTGSAGQLTLVRFIENFKQLILTSMIIFDSIKQPRPSVGDGVAAVSLIRVIGFR